MGDSKAARARVWLEWSFLLRASRFVSSHKGVRWVRLRYSSEAIWIAHHISIDLIYNVLPELDA